MSDALEQVEHNGAAAVDRIHAILRQLRSKYSVDRAELAAAVDEQVSGIRAEVDVAQQTSRECTAAVDGMRRHLAALETAHDGPADLLAATASASERLDAVQDSFRRCADETQLVKTALLNDRMRREARRRQQESEDAELQLRLQHVEDTNAALRSELHVVKMINCDSTAAVMELLQECRVDAPTAHAAGEMEKLREGVMGDLRRVREDQAVLTGRVETVVAFCEDEEARRKGQVAALEQSLKQIEQRPPLPSYRPRVDAAALAERGLPRHGGGVAGLVETPGRVEGSQLHLVPTGAAAAAAAAAPGVFPSFPSHRERIATFYSRYNPAKLGELDAVMAEYAGAEAELMSALEIHYGAFGYFSS
jgi:hypothetical protein